MEILEFAKAATRTRSKRGDYYYNDLILSINNDDRIKEDFLLSALDYKTKYYESFIKKLKEEDLPYFKQLKGYDFECSWEEDKGFIVKVLEQYKTLKTFSAPSMKVLAKEFLSWQETYENYVYDIEGHKLRIRKEGFQYVPLESENKLLEPLKELAKTEDIDFRAISKSYETTRYFLREEGGKEILLPVGKTRETSTNKALKYLNALVKERQGQQR